MTYWDDGSYAETDEDGAAEEVAALLDEDVSEEETDDGQLEVDVQRRIEVVSLYRALLAESFFTVDTEAARLCTRRLRRFVTAEVKALLGMGSPPRSNDFSPQQFEALKRIADKVLEKDGVSTAAPDQPNTLRRVEPPQAAALRKVDSRPTSPVRRVGPTPQPQQQPKPQAKPAPQQKPNRPQQKPSRLAAKNGPVGPTKREPTIKEVNPDAREGEKKIFRKESVENGRVVQQLIDDKGRVGETRDATPQVRPPDAMPMPNPHHVGKLMEVQALQTAEVADAGFGSIAVPQRRIQFG